MNLIEANAGFAFEKEVTNEDTGDNRYTAVQHKDQAAPCSNLFECFWKSKKIDANQKEISNCTDHAQLVEILRALSKNKDWSSTLGYCQGVHKASYFKTSFSLMKKKIFVGHF